ncbi:hypothetical protein H6P81_002188 [Aristolochia fimbriata]|uniref:Uncharacterized protein n=1 Tax=Aristolochia fimbriata TaxID=158543 RepID=A0AAV7F925_ARIFI|nr:hypothetical protein H6P81_002188 [Aristolochia fimbriata]
MQVVLYIIGRSVLSSDHLHTRVIMDSHFFKRVLSLFGQASLFHTGIRFLQGKGAYRGKERKGGTIAGIFSRFPGYRRSHSALPEDKNGTGVRAAEGSKETGCSKANGHGHVMEIDIDFVPIEHPVEPPDEDRPLKCPMPNSSVPNSGGMRNERSIESFRKKRVELPVAYEEEMVISPEPPAVRKRHHAPTPEYTLPLLLGTTQQCSILQMLQEGNEYES